MKDMECGLLSLLGRCLFERPSDADLTDEILEEAKAQSVIALISNDEYQAISQNIIVCAAHAKLDKILGDIPYVTIKGYASAYYYPQPVKRMMGDVDVYVEPEFFYKAMDAFVKSGAKREDVEHERHVTYRLGKVDFELHSELKGMPNGIEGIPCSNLQIEAKVRDILKNLVVKSRRITTEYGEVVIPDEFHHGVIMLLHVVGHMIHSGGVGLRHLCDWAVYADKVDLSKYREQFEDVGLWTFASQLTAVCSKYLGLREMAWAGEWDDDFLHELLRDFWDAGNFGRKTSGRTAGLKMAGNDSLLSVWTWRAKQKYPVASKCVLFIPFAMMAFAIKYFWTQNVKEKKSVNIHFADEGKRRNELYQKFRLFE